MLEMPPLANCNVLVTGGSGFVGRPLLKALRGKCAGLRLLNRSYIDEFADLEQLEYAGLENIEPEVAWFEGIDIEIHLAARVHQMNADPKNERQLQIAANTEATEKLAKVAAIAGVKQFIYVSSIKVNGEHTEHRSAFTELDSPAPQDDYGNAKWLAEEALLHVTKDTEIAATIIRPPLIYGPGVKANFAALLKLSAKGLPLPIAAIKNARHILAVDNLVDFLLRCCADPEAFGEVFLLADDQPLSTPELVSLMAKSQGKSIFLLWLPARLLQLGAKLAGKRSVVDRLTQSLQVNNTKAKQILGWQPPLTTQQAFDRYSQQWSEQWM